MAYSESKLADRGVTHRRPMEAHGSVMVTAHHATVGATVRYASRTGTIAPGSCESEYVGYQAAPDREPFTSGDAGTICTEPCRGETKHATIYS